MVESFMPFESFCFPVGLLLFFFSIGTFSVLQTNVKLQLQRADIGMQLTQKENISLEMIIIIIKCGTKNNHYFKHHFYLSHTHTHKHSKAILDSQCGF